MGSLPPRGWGAAILASVLATGSAGAAILRVGPAQAFATVGSALAAAAPGDVIEVAPGVYAEKLEITQPVTLRGRGEPHLVGGGDGNVVSVVADGVEVSGFAIHGSGRRMMTGDAGVRVLGDRARIRGNRIFDNLFGVYLDQTRETRVEGNTITGREADDIGRRGAGIHLFDAHHNLIRGNTVSRVRDGVYFDHADFNSVESNEFHHLRYGVHYMYCSDNRFVDNTFRESLGGVAIMYSERVVFSDNRILDNREGYHAFGLLFKDTLDSVAERNLIVNNGSGIFLDSSHRNRFRDNLLAYNSVGVMLYASSLENSFAGNDFLANLATLHTVGRAQADWTPEGRGNFYSDYRGFDLDGDGRGDVPHRLQDAFEVLVGNHPLLQLYLTSATADALAAAERSFPLLPSSEQVDATPAMRPVSGVRAGFGAGGGRPPSAPRAVAGWLVVLAAAGWLTSRWRG